MPFEGQPIHLTDAQRDDLEEIARSNALPAGFVQRAKIVLLLADAVSARAVETKLDVCRPTIAKWRRRFLEHGVEGLTNRHRGRPRWKLTVRLRARVLAGTRRPPPDGTTHWSCRRLAAHLGVDKNIVQRIWRHCRPSSVPSAPAVEPRPGDVETLPGDSRETAAVRAAVEALREAVDGADAGWRKDAAAAAWHPAAVVRFLRARLDCGITACRLAMTALSRSRANCPETLPTR